MANRKIIDSGLGFLAKAPDFSLPKGSPAGLAELLTVSGTLQAIIDKINGGLTIGDASQASRAGNLDAQWIPDVMFTAANTPIAIYHGLGRRVVAYDVKRRDRACIIFDGNIGSWSDDVLYLQSNTASALVSLIVY